ncbi:MAG: hypothetical protein NT178_13480 [Proteobacteria bacterium]|nr:hypothetical protein [Pseudomonadota bacterium]
MQKSKIFIGWHSLLYLCLINFILLLFLHSAAIASDKEELEVRRDKEKTVYTIDSKDDQKKDEDKANAWEMLKNKNIWIQPK